MIWMWILLSKFIVSSKRPQMNFESAMALQFQQIYDYCHNQMIYKSKYKQNVRERPMAQFDGA